MTDQQHDSYCLFGAKSLLARLQNVAKEIDGVRKADDIEAIHDMRLSIKRIKVVAKLADQLSDNTFNAKVTLATLNKFFKTSGRLRDIQVTKQLLIDLQNAHLAPVIESFSSREKKQRNKYEQALSTFNKETLGDIELRLVERLKGLTAKAAMAGALLLLSDYLHDIRELFYSSSREKRLHEVRTRLKDINYLNNIFDEQIGIETQLNISAERLRELGELAGSWHDHLNLEMKLGKFIHKHPNIPQQVSIQEAINKLQVRKQELQQEYSCILMNELKI